MRTFSIVTASAASIVLSSAVTSAQELSPSGVFGVDLVYATDPAGTSSQLYFANAEQGVATALGNPIAGVPSRWVHRRRTLSALETEIALADPFTVMTPIGDAVGNGGIHFVDGRTGAITSDFVVPTGNPAGYDLALVEPLSMVFSAEDDGAGGTTLRGFSYAVQDALTPLSPASLSLPGTPSAYVNRIGVDLATLTLHVPTEDGVQLVSLSASAPHMTLGAFLNAGAFTPTTNPRVFDATSGRTWIVGTSSFSASGAPREAGYLAWSFDGSSSWSAGFGVIPGRTPTRRYVPAIGCEELALVSDGADAYAYYLLRDPDPSSFFIRGAAVGAVRFVGGAAPVLSTLLTSDATGEPFSIPTVHGARVAFESSMGPPFWHNPPGGAEKISVIYTPLDTLGAGSADGVLATAGPLGGRISCKGMDRPLWTEDGRGIFATTSHFAGTANPGTPGLEYLGIPKDAVVDDNTLPVTLVDNPVAPNQSITLGSSYRPHDPTYGGWLSAFSFCGTLFHDGFGSAMEWKKGKKQLGQRQDHVPNFVQSPDIPDFPAIFPPTFDDATGSSVPIPASFGARRVSFDLHFAFGFTGFTMVAAMDDVVYVQPTGVNFLAELGFGTELDPLEIPLPSGWITTSEIRSW